MTKQRGDQGFTLIELLLVIVVIGILATIVVASVKGVTDDTQQTSCDSDAHVLHTAGEAYFAQRTSTTIAPIGSGPDRFEQGLVNEGFLREPSKYFDLDADGGLQPASGSPCTP
jgi:general secretion pathway protein G